MASSGGSRCAWWPCRRGARPWVHSLPPTLARRPSLRGVVLAPVRKPVCLCATAGAAAGLGRLTSLRARSCRYVKWLGPPVRSSLTLKSPPQWYALLLLVAASCCGFPQPADNSSADCHLAGVGPDAYSVRENFLVSFSTYYLYYSSTTTYPRLSPVLQLSLPFPPALPRCTVVYLLCFISSLTANFCIGYEYQFLVWTS